MKPRSAKNKGARFQNWVAERLRELLGLLETGHNIPFKEHDAECEKDDRIVKPREMGQNGVDIVINTEFRKLFPYAIECKNVEKLAWWKAIEQSRENTSESMPDWLLIVKRNRERPVAVVDFETFLRIHE